ncbi:MAG: acyl-CoA thioesterase [Planctomycetota bacterium]
MFEGNRDMSNRFVMPRRVEFVDTDMAGIVHFTAFFRYMETAEHEMFRSLGLSPGAGGREPHVGWPRVRCGFDFIKPLRFGDEAEVHIGVERIGAASIAYEAEIVRNGEIVARGHSTSACCEVGPGTQMTPVPVPVEVSEKLKQYLIPEPQPSVKGSQKSAGDHSK